MPWRRRMGNLSPLPPPRTCSLPCPTATPAVEAEEEDEEDEEGNRTRMGMVMTTCMG